MQCGGYRQIGSDRVWMWALAVLLVMGLSAPAAVQEVDDRDITAHIETEYWTDDTVPVNAVEVVTNEGIVTLSGTVTNILAKDRAQKIAEATVGVRAVLNRITVSPPAGRSDEQIQQAVQSALKNDPATDRFDVNVNVRNGTVTLTGTVDSWQEKQLCTAVAKGVKGVVGVTNDMTFDYPEDRPDSEIASEVRRRLARDVRIDDALVEVKVQNDVVTLSGTVGSLQEKNQAVNDAWVGGVESVNAEALEIEWWARDRMRRKQLYVTMTDDQIKDAVKDAFVYDPRVYSFDISVEVTRGAVTLRGVVDNLQARQAAETDARNTIGVRRVINKIKVRPQNAASSEELKDRVTDALLEDPYIERFALDVSAYDGTVYLSGDVNTSWEKNRAQTLAEGVKGVLYVVNNIDSRHRWVWKPDWEIRQDVKDQFFWSPFVDGGDIQVTVDNGIVTLTGQVQTYSERQSAASNAFEAGAKDVDNNLAVTYQYYGPYYDTLHGPYSIYSDE